MNAKTTRNPTKILNFWNIMIMAILIIYALMLGSEFDRGTASAFMSIFGGVLGLSISDNLILKSDYYLSLANPMHRNLFYISMCLIGLIIGAILGASLGFYLYHLFS